jgi:3-deoxy-D-manno-octulosonic-acid transferase
MRPVLRNVDVFLAQSEEDRRRLAEIGAPADRVHVSGNLKFDLRTPAQKPIVASLLSVFDREGIGPVLVAGSTVEGEEPLLLDAFTALRPSFPKMVLILAPRHPERFQQVAGLIRGRDIPFLECSTWNTQNSQSVAGGLVLLDTMGDLAAVYALADVALVGGSLVPRGGHNILEAAQHGAAIVVGPHTENFRDIVNLFRDANAVVVTTPEQLTATLLDLLRDPERRRELGRRAADVLRQNAGATARTLAALEALLGPPGPAPDANTVSSRQEA